MKKLKNNIILCIVLCMSLILTACNNDKKAFDISKLAYDNINEAYEITEQFSEDIYQAWHLGIFEDDSLLENGIEYLSSKLNLTTDELIEGAVYTYTLMVDDVTYESLSEENKKFFRDSTDVYFELNKDDLVSSCIAIIIGTYKTNGKIEKIQTSLDDVKSQLKKLNEKYSDYKYNDDIQEYYTITSSFFNFCQEPYGSSFDQMKNTINDYKNKARDSKNNLDYIFD